MKNSLLFVVALFLPFQRIHATFIVAEKLQGTIDGHVKTVLLLGDIHKIHPTDNSQFETIVNAICHLAADFLVEGNFKNQALQRTLRKSAVVKQQLLMRLAAFCQEGHTYRNIEMRDGAMLLEAIIQRTVDDVGTILQTSPLMLAMPIRRSKMLNSAVFSRFEALVEEKNREAKSVGFTQSGQLNSAWAANNIICAYNAVLHYTDGPTTTDLYQQELTKLEPTCLGKIGAPFLSKLWCLFGAPGHIPFGMIYPMSSRLSRLAIGESMQSVLQTSVLELFVFLQQLRQYSDKILELNTIHEILTSSRPNVIVLTGVAHVPRVSQLLSRLEFKPTGARIAGEHTLRLLELIENPSTADSLATEIDAAEPLPTSTINEFLSTLQQ